MIVTLMIMPGAINETPVMMPVRKNHTQYWRHAGYQPGARLRRRGFGVSYRNTKLHTRTHARTRKQASRRCKTVQALIRFIGQ